MEFTDSSGGGGGGAMTIPEEFRESGEGGGGGGVKLKRASSWRKFKDTVKGWVGTGQGAPEDQGGNSTDFRNLGPKLGPLF